MGEIHLRISRHDRVVAIIIGGCALDVQVAGPVALSKLPVMDVFPQDLLAVLEPVNLFRGVQGKKSRISWWNANIIF